LQVLSEVHRSGKSLYELKSGMQKYPQTLINVRIEKKIALEENESIQAAVKKIKEALGDKGRVLLRASGTEPLIRVMVEGVDAQDVKKYAQQLADVVKTAI